MRNSIRLIPLFFIIILAACDEEEECVGCNLNPKIKIKFEAITSKPYIDSLFMAVTTRIEEGEERLQDSLSVDEKTIVENSLVEFRLDSATLNEDYMLFRSNKTRIDVLEAKGAILNTLFQDTVIRDFAVPVDMQHDTSTFYFTYHGFTDTLQIFYQRDVIQTFDGVRMKINGIGVNQEISTFDSIRVKCYNVECSNDQTTIFLYF